MNIDSVKSDLLENLRDSKEYREAFVENSVYTMVSFQICTMREQRGWSQKELGKKVKMAQERISILEDPNAETKPTLVTLLRIAAGYDCGLEVRFIPFSKVLDDTFNSGPADLRVASFDEETDSIDGESVEKVESIMSRSAAKAGFSESASAGIPGGLLGDRSASGLFLVRQKPTVGAAALVEQEKHGNRKSNSGESRMALRYARN